MLFKHLAPRHFSDFNDVVCVCLQGFPVNRNERVADELQDCGKCVLFEVDVSWDHEGEEVSDFFWEAYGLLHFCCHSLRLLNLLKHLL